MGSERPVCTCLPEEAMSATVCNKCFGDLETYNPATHRVVPRDAVVLEREDAKRMLDLARLAEQVAKGRDIRAWARNRRMVKVLRSALDGEGCGDA